MKITQKFKGFTLIEGIVVVVIIGVLVAIAVPNFINAEDRSKVASIKANMHTTQIMLETYSIDYQAKYPLDSASLKEDGVAKNYWRVFKNPVTTASDIGGSLNDYTPTPTAGVSYYDPVASSTITKYYIYGGDIVNGKFIQESGVNLTLSNK